MALLELLLPGRCAACRAWGRVPWCESCEAAVGWIDRNACDRCARPSPRPASDCRDCRGRRYAFDRSRAVAVYEGPAREAVKAFKLLGERRMAAALAGRMAVAAAPFRVDTVTWVPSRRASEASRGFNPAEELARAVGRNLALPVKGLLVKTRDTPDQAGLSRFERVSNLRAAFASRRAVDGRVLLVDDILTTGSTAHECAAALKRGGAASVFVVAFARAL